MPQTWTAMEPAPSEISTLHQQQLWLPGSRVANTKQAPSANRAAANGCMDYRVGLTPQWPIMAHGNSKTEGGGGAGHVIARSVESRFQASLRVPLCCATCCMLQDSNHPLVNN